MTTRPGIVKSSLLALASRNRLIALIAGGVTLASACGDAATPPAQYQLTVSAAGTGGGRISSTPTIIDCSVSAGASSGTCTGQMPPDQSVILTGVPASGSTFRGWSGDCSGASTCRVESGEHHAVVAEFTVNDVSVSTVSVSPATQTVAVGAAVPFPPSQRRGRVKSCPGNQSSGQARCQASRP